MQEFVTIPTHLIEEPKNKPYSKIEAYIDILNMADESGGEFETTRRTLENRWGWSGRRVNSFLSELEERTIIEPRMNQKRTKIKPINTGFYDSKRTKNEPKTNQKRTNEKQQNSDYFREILGAWNELSEYGIEPIPAIGISSVQYKNLKSITEKYGADDVIRTIQRIKISDFLQGKVTSWKISFNWFLKIGNYEKVRSGQYDGGGSKKTNKGAVVEQKHEDEELIGDEWVDL